ncbi:hypothetical protein ES288_A13G051600v1 [Gossypium darwinii]|uniref:Uncharacterized protein n=1 Tax=Gossypium darwinii TaxID=34276 RepID=A0A5D2DWG5_GOSDA|nr:hypothetical protein ES288_A13G051600v1 [Gossypium darwinii]
MGLPCTMALWFQLLLLMCGSGIHGVKNLREKQGDAQLVRKELEDKYSRIAAWKPFVDKTPQSSSQLAKELEDKYSRIAAWKPFVDKTPQSSSQLAKELEDSGYNIPS